MDLHDRVMTEFERRFGRPSAGVARAPGRVNLIGEHTDYNEGFVLPMAIDRAVWLALRRRDDDRVRVYSLDFDQQMEFSAREPGTRGRGWGEYIKGVAWAWGEAGLPLRGWDGVLAGDVPIGAGLSSSAALELAAARAFAAAGELVWDGPAMARLALHAESGWVGMKCGIMDQMISACGVAGKALLIDCRSLETQAVPLPPATSVVILDTGTQRGLVDTAYNERRAQCEAAARALGASALRDITWEAFAARESELEPLARRRARHVVSEDQRTLEAAEGMRQGDASRLGALMNASHVSLRDDFEVSSRELDIMVECAQETAGCYGARMTGAGFGGCAVALTQTDASERFACQVAEQYAARSVLKPKIYVCTASAGAAYRAA